MSKKYKIKYTFIDDIVADTKEKAIEYAKKNNINFQVIEPKKSNFIIKSYADNFLKD